MTVAAVVLAAGRGERMGGELPKALLLLAGEPLIVHAVRGLRAAPSVGQLVVAAPPERVEQFQGLLQPYDVLVVAGGAQRQDSVRLALAALNPDVDLVLVHDAARALTPVAVIQAVVGALRAGAEAVIPVLPIADTVKRVAGDGVVDTLDRVDLRAVQTPQGFTRQLLVQAHAQPGAATDDAALVEQLGRTVVTVAGSDESFKLTRPFDLLVAEAVLRARG